MRVLMLGWEFPPFIAGGLGTACHGLTKAMDRRGMDVTFVLPKSIDRSESSHVNLLAPEAQKSVIAPDGRIVPVSEGLTESSPIIETFPAAGSGTTRTETVRIPFEHVRFIGVPAGFSNPYQKQSGEHPVGRWVIRRGVSTFIAETETPLADDVEPATYEQLQASAPRQQEETQSPVAPPTGDDYSAVAESLPQRWWHRRIGGLHRSYL